MIIILFVGFSDPNQSVIIAGLNKETFFIHVTKNSNANESVNQSCPINTHRSVLFAPFLLEGIRAAFHMMSVVGAQPFIKPMQTSPSVSPGIQRRHTLPASEVRPLNTQDAISVFEIEREGEWGGSEVTTWGRSALKQKAQASHSPSAPLVCSSFHLGVRRVSPPPGRGATLPHAVSRALHGLDRGGPAGGFYHRVSLGPGQADHGEEHPPPISSN